MEKTQLINRNIIAEGIYEIISQQRSATRKQISDDVTKAIEMDERMLVLSALKEAHPSMEDIFQKAAEDLLEREIGKKTAGLPSIWLYGGIKDTIRARLELMTDDEIRKYTLEELTDLVKDQ